MRVKCDSVTAIQAEPAHTLVNMRVQCDNVTAYRLSLHTRVLCEGKLMVDASLDVSFALQAVSLCWRLSMLWHQILR